MNPSNLAWWEWLLCAALAGIAVPVVRGVADDTEGNAGFILYVISVVLQVVAILAIVIGIAYYVNWWGGSF
jgi:hypothetical protein